MSMPVATYKCTACDFSRWDSITWGYRYYIYGEVKVPMRVTTGWCQSCNDLAPIEVLPTAVREIELRQKLEELKVELDVELAVSSSKVYWWQRYARKKPQHRKLEAEISLAKAHLEKYRLSREALSTRTSNARCLMCRSEYCAPLPPHEVEYFDMRSAPAPTGFVHPDCGGQLVTIYDGTRLNFVPKETAYDLEGRQALQ